MMEQKQKELQKVHKSMGRPKKNLEAEERAKREIANSNERRRMQNINTGFSCLRQILKKHNNIEKHSKAAILHQSASYIRKLEQDINHFTEQNQMLKTFVDTYQTKRANRDQSEDSVEERVDMEEDIEEDSTYVPPDKRTSSKPLSVVEMRSTEDIAVNKLPGDSPSIGNHILNKRTVLQSPQELTQILEKEVNQLRSLLERERQIRTELETKQQRIGTAFEPNNFAPMSSAVFPVNRLPANHMLRTQTPMTFSYHINYEDRPLNLKTNGNSFNGFPINAMQYSNCRFGQHRYNISHKPPSKYASHMSSAVNIYRPNAQSIKQENETHVKPDKYYTNTDRNTPSLQLLSSPTDQSQTIPLPLIKKPSLDVLKHDITSNTPGQSPTMNTCPTTSSSSGRSGTELKESLQLIIKAIQHIEGEKGVKCGDSSNYIKQMAEKFNISSTSVLKHLLSNDYRNSKPTVHSVDSLM